MYEYLKLGHVFGPVTGDELLDLTAAGVIDPDDRVREQGDLGYRAASDVVALLRAARLAEHSGEAPRLSQSSRPSVGTFTVFGSVPPLPPNPVPKIDRLHCPSCGNAVSLHVTQCVNCNATLPPAGAPRCTHENPQDALFCGTCGASLAP